MKGHIVIPEFYRNRWTDDYKHLLAMVANEFKFKIEYNDNPGIAKDLDVLILFAVPHHMRPEVLSQMADVPRSVKIIGYMKDIHHFDNPVAISAYKRMFDRYDVILSSAYQLFEKLYPEHMKKMVYFPDFFAPYERYVKERPQKNRCLLSGTVNEIYPLRQYILENGSEEWLDYLPGPIVGHDYIGDKYADLLGSYSCCVTCSSIFKYTLAKYFEIPASGSLLIADTSEDLERLGFVPEIHFTPITKENVMDRIQDVIKNPVKYENIKEYGSKWVRENHSIYNRFEQIKRVINESID